MTSNFEPGTLIVQSFGEKRGGLTDAILLLSKTFAWIGQTKPNDEGFGICIASINAKHHIIEDDCNLAYIISPTRTGWDKSDFYKSIEESYNEPG